jgi:hypothetical protein
MVTDGNGNVIGAITILAYTNVKGADANGQALAGVGLKLGYQDASSGLQNFNFVQVVVTNNPNNNQPKNAAFIDGNPANTPFYYTPQEITAINKITPGYSVVFTDAPARAQGQSTNWNATLLLTGANTAGQAQVLQTMTWGFSMNSTGINISPIVFIDPNPKN